MPQTAGFYGILDTLRQPNFRIYVAGNSLSMIGTWIQRLAVGWLTWELTKSGAWLGIVAFADLFPAIVIGPFGGALADRISRFRIIRVTQTLAMLQAAVLFLLVAFDLITIELVVALTLFHGIIIGFHQPSRLAFVRSLVPIEHISTAVAVNSIVFHSARFIGPAIAGLAINHWGIASAFALNTISFISFLVALTRLKLPETAPRDRQGARPSILGEILEGIRYSAGHPGIAGLLILLLFISVGVRPFEELLPGFVDQVFGRGVDALAKFASTAGIGAMLGALWMAHQGQSADHPRVFLICSGLVALSILGFIATDNFWVALPFIAIAAGGLVICGISSQIMMHLSVPNEVRGRVLSLFGIIFRGGSAFGALVMGGLSESFGLRWPLGGGIAVTLVVWVWFWSRRELISGSLKRGQNQD